MENIFLLLIILFIIFTIIYFLNTNDNKLKNDKVKFCKYKEWNLDQIDSEELEYFIGSNISKCKDTTFLLNTNKDKFNILEKYIYELCMFHLNRLGKKYDPKKYSFEYWFKNENINYENSSDILHRFHIDKDEKNDIETKYMKTPMLSTVTYVTESKYPTIISNLKKEFNNISEDEYNFKLLLSSAKKNKHICFDGSNFHGVINFYKNNKNYKEIRKTFMINIWENHVPKNVKYYENTNDNMEYFKDKQYILINNKEKNYKNYKLKKSKMNNIFREFNLEKIDLFKKYINMDINKEFDSNFNIIIDGT